MLGWMLSRVLALAIAVCTGATGVLPSGDGSRCIAMGVLLQAGDDCCAKCDATSSIGTPCCEVIHGRILEARGPSSAPQTRIAPAPLVGILSFAAPASLTGCLSASLTTHARGGPPGDQLERFSAILRI